MRYPRLGFVLTAAVVAPVGSGVAQGGGPINRFTPADIFQLEFASDPQISPDGQSVVYVRQWSDLMTDRRYSNLWIVKADGSDHRPLTTGKFSETMPRWSADGKRLAYLSNRGGTPQIYVRWMDTGTTLAVTNVTEPPSGIDWSPDGTKLAFLKLVPQPALVVGSPLVAPSGAAWAPPPKYTDKLVFRYDQLGELPTGFVHAFVVPAEGGTPRQVTTGDFQHGGQVFGGGSLTWTPDNTELILSARRGPNPEWNARETDLWAVNVTTGALRQLTDRFGPDGSPAVSPDGKMIAYTGYDDRKQGYQNTLLYLMNRDGTGKREVSAKLDRSVSNPTWTADSRGIYVSYDDQGNTKVALFQLDGTSKPLAKDLGGGGSAYGSGSFSVSKDGSIAYGISTPWVPSEVAVTRVAPTATTKVLTSTPTSSPAELSAKWRSSGGPRPRTSAGSTGGSSSRRASIRPASTRSSSKSTADPSPTTAIGSTTRSS
jgi:acylaminoacyl-peptidase